MKYLLLIYTAEGMAETTTQEEQSAIMGEYYAFTNEVNASGVFNAGEALMPTTTATTVRMHQGKTVTTDGPFAETKEQLGGYYLLECKDLDEAIGWAAKIPGARFGSIEVRPIMTMG